MRVVLVLQLVSEVRTFLWKTVPLTGEVWPNSSYLVSEVTAVTKVPCDSHSSPIPTLPQYLFPRESVTLLSELRQDLWLSSPIYETIPPGPQLVDPALTSPSVQMKGDLDPMSLPFLCAGSLVHIHTHVCT